MAWPGTVDHPAPIDVLEVPLIACADEADWRHVALAPVVELELAPTLAVEVLPTHEAPSPRRLCTGRVRLDLFADEPGRKDRGCDSTRDAISSVY